MSDRWQRRLRALVIDEAHVIVKYSQNFRPEYKKIREVRAIIPNVQVLAVTGTASEMVQREILSSLGITRSLITSASPIRQNLEISFFRVKELDYEHELIWILQGILKEKDKFARGLIFCRTIYDVEDIGSVEVGSAGTLGSAGKKKKKRKKKEKKRAL
eukprot:Pompholyxophrys_punicea_v1_NODE_944_length_1112_cov_2.399243.p1 type:complete len:159 gc:universal NODE_944_length_1112_cov_2.399243:551-75(-)